jgi:outer membrane protein assembly factor BamD
MKRVAVIAVLILLVACSTKNRQDKFFNEVSALSKEEVMAKGDGLLEKKKYEEARKYYSFLADSFPNDPLGRIAALKVADSFFAGRDLESLTEAQVRYKDFVNRFPNDPNRPYALLMLGKCSFDQGKGPMRDLTPINDAAGSFRQLVEQYPDSTYTPEASDLLGKCEQDLGEHELLVARYYWNVGAWAGARMRLEYLLSHYPATEAAQKGKQMLADLGERGTFPSSTRSATPVPSPSVGQPQR